MKISTGVVIALLSTAVLAGCSPTDDTATPSTTTATSGDDIFRGQVQALADTVTSPQAGVWTPEEFVSRYCRQYTSKPGSTQRMVAKDLALGAAVASGKSGDSAKQEAVKREDNALWLISNLVDCESLPRG
ncbi:hypothetical protein ACFROC_01940 [Nocardia tengchongensis]|uniref:hypothetical protein n=1 Tax=Nocardia tengchongensis TaxID=2055889 RepID=UPI0036BD8ADB